MLVFLEGHQLGGVFFGRLNQTHSPPPMDTPSSTPNTAISSTFAPVLLLTMASLSLSPSGVSSRRDGGVGVGVGVGVGGGVDCVGGAVALGGGVGGGVGGVGAGRVSSGGGIRGGGGVSCGGVVSCGGIGGLCAGEGGGVEGSVGRSGA